MRETPEPIGINDEPVHDKNLIRGQVSLRHVAFSYPSRPEMQVLKDINIEVEPGQRIALVGPSGTGKTTLSSLLLRFYEPDSGQVLFRW